MKRWLATAVPLLVYRLVDAESYIADPSRRTFAAEHRNTALNGDHKTLERSINNTAQELFKATTSDTANSSNAGDNFKGLSASASATFKGNMSAVTVPWEAATSTSSQPHSVTNRHTAIKSRNSKELSIVNRNETQQHVSSLQDRTLFNNAKDAGISSHRASIGRGNAAPDVVPVEVKPLLNLPSVDLSSPESKKADLLTPEEKIGIAHPVSKEEKLEDGSAVGVWLESWSSTPLMKESIPEGEHQEPSNKKQFRNGGLERTLLWNEGKLSSRKNSIEDNFVPIERSNYLPNKVLNEEATSPAESLIAKSKLEQVNEDREKFIDQMIEGTAKEDEAITIVDETVRWSQDDCYPCDVPTQPPTIAPLYSHQDDNPSSTMPQHEHCTKQIGDYAESNDCIPETTKPPTPAPTPVPTDKTCTDVSVEGDATYCIQGPICSGSDTNPAGSLCPIKGDVAVKDCSNDTLRSYVSTGKCVAPVNATCSKLKTGAWGCKFNEGNKTTPNPTGSPTPTPTQVPTDKTCTDVSVEGDATYCIQGPICSGSDTNPAGSLCPIKGDVAVKDCSNDTLRSYVSTGKCVAPVNATCSKLKTGAWGCKFNEGNKTTPNPTGSPTPTPTQVPTDKTCTDVSVEGDATYCIQGPICSGSDTNPAGSLCPIKGDVAVKDCSNDTLRSYVSTGKCVAPVNATCSKLKTGAWGCKFNEGNKTTPNPTGSPTPTPTQVPTDKTCTDVSVEGDATYCIQGPICSGSDTNPAGSLCPIKGDVAVKDCSNDTLRSYISTGKCVAPVNATCSQLKSGAQGCVFDEKDTTNRTTLPTPTQTDIPTPAPSNPSYETNEPTPSPLQPNEATPAPTKNYYDEPAPTPAPSNPSYETKEPTPSPLQPNEVTPAPTKNYYDEPVPSPAASFPEGGAYPTENKVTPSSTTEPSTSKAPTSASVSNKPTEAPMVTPLNSTEDTEQTKTSTSGANVNVSQVSTSKGTTANKSSDTLSGGAIAGIVTACILFVVIVVGAVLFKQRSIARQREEDIFADLSAPGGRPLETDYAAM